MPLSIYDACVPTYLRLMRALSGTLDKAAAHAAERKIEPEILTSARLYPDMWSLAQQVRAVCNHGVRGPARLTGTEPPTFDDDDAGFEGLKRRIAWAIAWVEDMPRSAFDGAEDREIVFPAGDETRTLSGQDYLFAFSMPNLMFHSATAYDILRHNGVPLAKDDFIGR
jgi:uncharacterized protein